VAFFVFIVLNAVLYVRPGDWLPALQSLHLYEIVILACTALGLPRLVALLAPSSMAENPITGCVVGMFAVTVLTEVFRLRLDAAYEAADLLVKVLIYFLLLVGLVDTPGKLRWLLRSLVVCGVVTLVLAVLHYQGLATIPGMNVTTEIDHSQNPTVEVRRLGTTSIFGDPNDCALFIDHCILICLYLAWDGGGPVAARVLWLVPMTFCGYALTLTQSRGGLASLIVGLAAYAVGRYGRKAVMIGLGLSPVALAVLSGRQGNIQLSGGTGQQRVQLWTEYFNFFLGNPLLGLGWQAGPDAAGLMAHNAYLQSFGEQGFFAGTLFLGAFYLAFRSFGRIMTRPGGPAGDPVLTGMRPCLLGIVVSQMVGMMALTRNMVLPTYTLLGMTAAYARLAGVDPPLPRGRRLAKHLLAVSVLFLLYIWFVIRFNLRYA